MEAFTEISSRVCPFPVKDIDTDMIIPAQYLTSTTRAGYGEHLFQRIRESEPGMECFAPIYEDAKILIADSNFGCGSSREHAVWALQQKGFRAIIAPSFADIFTNNSLKNGLVLVTLAADVVTDLLEKAVGGMLFLTIDLPSQQVRTQAEVSFHFPFDSFRKHCIMNGFDDLDYILSYRDDVARYESKRVSYCSGQRGEE
ncbi:3-isopropylmalate dehydratase small subunit [Oligoflexia bacterium]|nr:3-isopropylmalate dehydratase small subunit [Oligoflexia bacterium]